MAKTKHGIFRDMSTLNMDDMGEATDQEREQLQMPMNGNKKSTKPKKSM